MLPDEAAMASERHLAKIVEMLYILVPLVGLVAMGIWGVFWVLAVKS